MVKDILFAVLAICAAGGLLFALYKWIEKKLIIKVSDTSSRYKELIQTNKKYQFENLNEIYKYDYKYNTKAKFERAALRFDEIFEAEIEADIEKYEKIEESVEKNKKLLKKYIIDINGCYPEATKETNSTNIPLFIYKKIEKALFDQARIKPVISPVFVVRASYVSPKGRNSYDDGEEYSFEDMLHHMNVAVVNKANKETESYRRQKVRGMINDSIRYDVFKRDGFRCTLCGAMQSDGVKLVVDHIKPVAKGGSSDMSNLRTLCNRCNWGKSDKYDESGLN